jgi:magnesium chelatase subunit D
MEALCGTALVLGIGSARAPMLALRAARALAALDGRAEVTEADATTASRLVFATRATRLPPAQEQEAPPEQAPEQPPEAPPETDDGGEEEMDPQTLQDLVLAAVAAALPPDLLARLKLAGATRGASQGKAGAQKASLRRGRPIGTRSGDLRAGARISLIETLRAAAPWQPIRRAARGPGGSAVIEVRREDFRLMRFKQNSETISIFAVDASGSAALNRLAEAKGAVEMLLADCYVRRDKVAVIAFRGEGAEILLPPTNSLVRAKRSLAGLPGGGGTPLAAGIDAAMTLADGVRRRGQTPIIVLLTDGRANIPRQPGAGRAQAQEDALAAARQVRAAGMTALMVDTSPRPQDVARRLAAEMGAVYLPLPYANPEGLSRAVRAAAGA